MTTSIIGLIFFIYLTSLSSYLFNFNFFLQTSILNEVIKNKNLTSYFHKGYFFNIDKKIDLLKIKKKYKNIIKLF